MARPIPDLLKRARQIPGALDEISRLVDQAVTGFERAAGVYKDEHWGRRGKKGLQRSRATDPTSEPLVVLGSLTEIAYLTRKGDDREPVEYVHEFEGVLPELCHAPGQKIGGLVIVGGSYLVNKRGIVG